MTVNQNCRKESVCSFSGRNYRGPSKGFWRNGTAGIAAVVLASILCMTQAVAAAPPADQILLQINKIGPAEELKTLAHTQGAQPGTTQYDAVLDAVQTGASPWLQVAADIYPATDGGLHYELVSAVSLALQKNAVGVLEMTDKPFRLNDVCMQRLIEPTPAEARAFLHATRAALKRVQDARLRANRDACLKLLS
jgi:hypothetical protein